MKHSVVLCLTTLTLKLNNLQDTKWGKVILTTVMRPSQRFTSDDMWECIKWQGCAVGELLSYKEIALVLSNLGQPLAQEVDDLGQQFYYNVRLDGPLQAAKTLVSIHKAVRKLKKSAWYIKQVQAL